MEKLLMLEYKKEVPKGGDQIQVQWIKVKEEW